MPLPALGGILAGSTAFMTRTAIIYVAVDFIIKALVALGLGTVTYTLGNFGLTEIFNLIKAQLSAAPVAALQLVELGGFSEGASIIFGAFSMRLALVGFSKAKYKFTPPA